MKNISTIKVAIGSDHAGFDLKEKLISKYANKYTFVDEGTYSNDSVDYPDFGHKVGILVSNKEVDYGIVICGSGIGISIAANKIKGVRAALCTTSEHSKLSRLHNNANILAIGSRLTDENNIFEIVDVFFKTEFEGGRHQDRIEKIDYI